MPERVHTVVIDDSTYLFRLWFNDHGWLYTRLVGYTIHAKGAANYGTFVAVDDSRISKTVRLDTVLIP